MCSIHVRSAFIHKVSLSLRTSPIYFFLKVCFPSIKWSITHQTSFSSNSVTGRAEAASTKGEKWASSTDPLCHTCNSAHKLHLLIIIRQKPNPSEQLWWQSETVHVIEFFTCLAQRMLKKKTRLFLWALYWWCALAICRHMYVSRLRFREGLLLFCLISICTVWMDDPDLTAGAAKHCNIIEKGMTSQVPCLSPLPPDGISLPSSACKTSPKCTLSC